jgi:hypothetical protein
MRRERQSLRPPYFPNTLRLVAIIGEMGDSRSNLGFDGSAKNAIGPAKLAVILKRYPRFENRAENGRIRGTSPRKSILDRSEEVGLIRQFMLTVGK